MKAITISLSAALLAMHLICSTAWSATGDKGKPVFAYSAETNRYLVVYEKDVGGTSTNIDVYGQLVAADGTTHGAEFVISDAANVQIVPQVAYDSANQRFLVVWQDRSIDVNHDIHGQLVNADGSLFGSAIVIANTSLQELNPSVAHDPVNHKFLVAWDRTRVVGGISTSYYDVYGQLVDAAGTLGGPNFAIAEDGSYMGSRIAFDPANQRFLVAYVGVVAGPTFDIFGHLVNSDGSLFGATGFAISTVGSNQYLKAVTHDPVNNRFLVSWEDDRVDSYSNHDIYGQLVTNIGALAGSEIPLSTAANHQSFPAAAFGGLDQRFLVIWHDRRNGTDQDIYGQYLNADGSLYNTDSLINVPLVAAAGNQLFPSIAYNSTCSNFMVASEDRNASPIAIRYDLIGTPCAADTTPPAVVSQLPAGNATGIAVNTAITATFSEAMDDSTINSTNFTISGGVTGTVTYNAGTKTVTLTPSSNLSYSTTYTATVATGVTDLAGNALATDYTWSFTTGAAPDTIPPTTTASPAGGTYASVLSVTLATNETATIYYTIDGSTPTVGSSVYSGPISISTTTTLKFFARDTAGNSEAVKSEPYIIDTVPPATTASPAGGTYAAGQNITLATNETAAIHYTTDGSTPTIASTVYSGPIGISATKTLKFFARDTAGNSESVKSETYVIAASVYTVTATAGANGTIAPSGPQTVNFGAAPNFAITPATGYQIATVTGCGGSLAGSSYTAAAVTADCTVTATFSVVPVTVPAAPARDGIIIPDGGKSTPNLADALAALKHVTGTTRLSADEQAHADVAPLGPDGRPLGNGTLDVADVITILRRVIGASSW